MSTKPYFKGISADVQTPRTKKAMFDQWDEFLLGYRKLVPAPVCAGIECDLIMLLKAAKAVRQIHRQDSCYHSTGVDQWVDLSEAIASIEKSNLKAIL